MKFIEPTLEHILPLLNQVKDEMTPLWGTMTPHRMIEHLNVTLDLATGNLPGISREVDEEGEKKAKWFLDSEHPMPKNFKVTFMEDNQPLITDNLPAAIELFTEKWKVFEDYYVSSPDATHLHPNFGVLNKEQWLRIHSKHITHHLEQFGIIK